MRAWILAGSATLLSVVFVLVLRLPGLDDSEIVVLSNLGQLGAAAVAAAACGFTARRSRTRRQAWGFLSLGTGGWAAGQAVWTYYEVVLGTEVPFPSLADVGFTLFPLASGVGLLLWLGAQNHELAARGRDLLDGTLIAGSLLVLSWVTTLGSVVGEAGGGWLSVVLSIGYPIGDLVVGTLVLMALARGGNRERSTLVLLAVGLGGLAFADSAYLYLVSTEKYDSADLVSSGWVVGFLMVATAALAAPAPAYGAHAAPPGRVQTSADDRRPTRLRLTLPYLPLLAAMVVLGVSLLHAPSTPTVDLILGASLTLLVLIRQFLALLDNQQLLGELAVARDRLQHQALHDPLTGLANRVLFADRLDRALLRPDVDIAVLYCDLDDFKVVNDELGHEVGDEVLKLVAQRLRWCVRVTDTVARLGGDEFAILLEDAADAAQVADRVLASMQAPHTIHGQRVHTMLSVGVAHHRAPAYAVPPASRRSADPARPTRALQAVPDDAEARNVTALEVLRSADSAMYAAKSAGKARAVSAEGPSGERRRGPVMTRGASTGSTTR